VVLSWEAQNLNADKSTVWNLASKLQTANPSSDFHNLKSNNLLLKLLTNLTFLSLYICGVIFRKYCYLNGILPMEVFPKPANCRLINFVCHSARPSPRVRCLVEWWIFLWSTYSIVFPCSRMFPMVNNVSVQIIETCVKTCLQYPSLEHNDPRSLRSTDESRVSELLLPNVYVDTHNRNVQKHRHWSKQSR